jgi:hypothetical protein
MLAAVVSRGPSHPDDPAAAAGLIAITVNVAMADLSTLRERTGLLLITTWVARRRRIVELLLPAAFACRSGFLKGRLLDISGGSVVVAVTSDEM